MKIDIAVIMEDLVDYKQLSEVVASTEFSKYMTILEKVAIFIGLLHGKTCLSTMAEIDKKDFTETYE